MAAKRKNGKTNVADVTVAILREIRDEVRRTNERLDQTNERLDQTNEGLMDLRGEVHQLRAETSAGLARHERAIGKLVDEVKTLNDRFDNFLTGAHQASHRELAERHDQLETRVARLEKKSG